ncbi:outer membrane protein assembly factor BamB [Vibrio panuliri]|uniref:Outer membrane protein assembly factor BamB n=1 Tax=Vibrio panuliri TaxID=1381081 RepID=A0A1Q9HP55_9VIBR|nr:outer membrane protein assembly factor BamB [Vibrio panuliri]KAB1455154.1 outer membrane protein assembly factor BamB [Vibrio panuliri]OLQ91825.1 outer membrane protein assembly factor BamB [Vibrio panuliri]OLQ92621.1 outer membrane protein assembly factor BamB [Vibrio panuliri]
MKKLLNKALTTVAVLSVLAGCASEEDTIVMAPVPQVDNEFTASSVWSRSVGDGVEHYFSKLTPAYAYDKVFVASRQGEVTALNPETGDQLWSTDLEQDVPARLAGGIAAAYDKLFIGSENGEVIALNQETGELLWRAKVQGEVLSVPATDENLVMAHTSEGVLVALDQQSGEQKWAISTEVPTLTLRGTSAPMAVSGGVFWGTANGRLAAAIVQRGQLIWQQPIGTPKGATEIDRIVDVDASPMLMGSTLFVIGYNGQLTAIDLRSGQPGWKRTYSSATDLANDGSRVFLVTDKDHLVAVDARSGTELWNNKQLEHRLLTAPKVLGDYVVVGDSEGYLYWIDRSSGEFVSMQEEGSGGFAVGPILLDDGIVITTRNGNVKKLTLSE